MNTEVRELYSYTAKERSTFSYVDRYMERVDTTLDDGNTVGELGYILAGLFLTYRACNHTHALMTTERKVIAFDETSLHFKRLANARRLGGIEFTSAREYLNLAGVSFFKQLLLRPDRLLWGIATRRKGNDLT